LKNFLDDVSKAYYKGTPIISDVEFDKLSAAFGYSSVGYHEEGGVKLPYPMSSLENVFFDDVPVKGSLPLSEYQLIASPKLDGAAVALIYVQGELKSIVTRGNGKVGRDISHLISSFPVPHNISNKNFLQITGELIAPKSIPRARNYAAGALGLKEVSDFAEKDLTFVSYGVFPYQNENYSEDMKLTQSYGFNTVLDFDVTNYPTDGVVYRVDNYTKFSKLGNTAHHPKGAFALKQNKVGVKTILLDVVWQVGKSGVVSPVAILEPVEIGEVTVSRATLHNIKYIRVLNLEIGCTVEVVRAGEVIPRIIGRVD